LASLKHKENTMETRYYLGVAEPGPNNWAISFPNFPVGVFTVGDTFADLMAHASDALASAIEAMEEDGDPIPESYSGNPELTGYDPADYHDPHVVVVSVPVNARSVRINVTIEDGLLARLDHLAERSHANRSALLARGARLVLAASSLLEDVDDPV